MTSNDQMNNLIKLAIIIIDFIVMNLLIWFFVNFQHVAMGWSWTMKWAFLFANNFALLLSELQFSPVVHSRMASAADILRRIVGLALMQMIVAYIMLKGLGTISPSGKVLLSFMLYFLGVLVLLRLVERRMIKQFRIAGRNTRTVTFVGNDPELLAIYDKLVDDHTRGYRFLGYYADADMGEWTYSQHSGSRNGEELKERDGSLESLETKERPVLERLGTLQDFLEKMVSNPDELKCGDELYVSLSRRDRDIIKRISSFCDHRVIRFYYVPVSVESLGMRLKKAFLDDVEIFTTHEIPLSSPVNKFVKRLFDVIFSLLFLIPTAILFPFIYIIIKTQSPGPIFFKQKRTGLDGKDFEMLKFRSMHVNADADKVQATKDDPRKYPFGNFMRKSNIDELPQFWNVLMGDMSIVGPRPHMLAHTEQYSQLIDKYMVRHFVKPGLTGWAQVTGFRGETKELWQMEGRVKRDIWYIEHWSIWLDIRIVWLTAKTVIIHDKNAY